MIVESQVVKSQKVMMLKLQGNNKENYEIHIINLDKILNFYSPFESKGYPSERKDNR